MNTGTQPVTVGTDVLPAGYFRVQAGASGALATMTVMGQTIQGIFAFEQVTTAAGTKVIRIAFSSVSLFLGDVAANLGVTVNNGSGLLLLAPGGLAGKITGTVALTDPLKAKIGGSFSSKLTVEINNQRATVKERSASTAPPSSSTSRPVRSSGPPPSTPRSPSAVSHSAPTSSSSAPPRSAGRQGRWHRGRRRRHRHPHRDREGLDHQGRVRPRSHRRRRADPHHSRGRRHDADRLRQRCTSSFALGASLGIAVNTGIKTVKETVDVNGTLVTLDLPAAANATPPYVAFLVRDLDLRLR